MTLYIFDADGTLCDRGTGELLPNTQGVIYRLPRRDDIVIATNQGGVGLRYWMEEEEFGHPKKYPDEESVREQYGRVASLVGAEKVYYSFAYQSKSTGGWGPVPSDSPEWSREWRKPNPGMLIQAMKDFEAEKKDTVFVGDSSEDEEAAQAAGIDFYHADTFFNRQ